MKNIVLFIVLCFFQSAFGQKNFIDQPYIEITAKADSLVIPDRIHISIQLNESDNRNKKSVEELERTMETTLKKIDIDTEKDLSLLEFSSNFKNYFLKGQNVLKSKMYSLIVYDAVTAGKVLAELEIAGISNVNIERTEFSKAEELVLELKAKAIEKSKITAEKLAQPLNQKIGKALFISDTNTIVNALEGKIQGVVIRGASSVYGSRGYEPINTEFQKIRFEVQMNVKYSLD